MIPAKGCIKNYHWGKVGDDNYIARFNSAAPKTPAEKSSKEASSIEHSSNNNIRNRSSSNSSNSSSSSSSSSCNKNPPLAELWFGSHPSGPATLVVGDHMIKLDEFLTREPEMVGVVDHYYKYNKQLPFLFKILSIAQPLSLQAHPDKKLAQILHKRDPRNYPDSNHKPELAIALTDFHVLCDFRPHSEIVRYIEDLPPLRRLIGKKVCDQYTSLARQQLGADDEMTRAALGECFKRLMVAKQGAIIDESICLLTSHNDVMSDVMRKLVVKLCGSYHDDPGIFAPFFLNYLKLSPGQAIYLKANKLHAYLEGECIECMACSDNVVRACLTTKYKDVQTLVDMLDYETVKSSQDLIILPRIKQQDECAIALFAPTDEFQVERIVVSDKQDYVLPSVRSGSFIIVLEGKAVTKDFFDLRTRHKLSLGFAGFVPPKIQLRLTDIQGTLVMYRAFC